MIRTRLLEKTSAPQTQTVDTEAAAPEGEAPAAVMRVLHVEDNPADALLMQEYLHGVLPSVVFDTAVRLAELTADRAAAADCALLDLSLPDASGIDAVIALRTMSENLPIIVLTGFDNLELGLAAVKEGADDYLVKSHVDGYSLERAVQYSVERRRLMLEIASSSFAASMATAAARTAVEATEAAENARMAEAVANAHKLEAEKAAAPQPVRAAHTPELPEVPRGVAVGTHEVSVRVDAESGDYALRCISCDWEADRGTDGLHSWSDRSLDVVLLHHLDYSGLGEDTAVANRAGKPLPRRRVLRPRTWFADSAATAPSGAASTGAASTGSASTGGGSPPAA